MQGLVCLRAPCRGGNGPDLLMHSPGLPQGLCTILCMHADCVTAVSMVAVTMTNVLMTTETAMAESMLVVTMTPMHMIIVTVMAVWHDHSV